MVTPEGVEIVLVIVGAETVDGVWAMAAAELAAELTLDADDAVPGITV